MLNESLLLLDKWYKARKRALPWRDNASPYRVWISEIMLQQTVVKTVIPYFERFISRFPDLQTLAESSLDEILKYWAGLGYYSRARNIHRTAVILASGGFPDDRKGFEKLPGIGAYTAGAILSIAFHKPEPILDANVKRVLSRVFLRTDKQTLWSYSRSLVNKAFRLGIDPSGFNQSLMELGALVCSIKKPDCRACPLSAVCHARLRGTAELVVKVRPRSYTAISETKDAIIRQDGLIMLVPDQSGWRKGLYDFPDSPVLPDNFPGPCLVLSTSHAVTRYRITRNTRLFILNTDLPPDVYPHNAVWADPSQPHDTGFALGAPCRSVLKLILKKIRPTDR